MLSPKPTSFFQPNPRTGPDTGIVLPYCWAGSVRKRLLNSHECQCFTMRPAGCRQPKQIKSPTATIATPFTGGRAAAGRGWRDNPPCRIRIICDISPAPLALFHPSSTAWRHHWIQRSVILRAVVNSHPLKKTKKNNNNNSKVQLPILITPRETEQSFSRRSVRTSELMLGLCSDPKQLTAFLHQQGLVLRWNAAWLTVRLVCLLVPDWIVYCLQATAKERVRNCDDTAAVCEGLD